MSNPIQHLESLCVIHTDFDIWSGQTRLEDQDIKLGHGGEIPPREVTNLGSKKVCDPDHLKAFSRIKTMARRILLEHGMPFMSGFAIPASKADVISKKLEEISKDFEKEKRRFLASYDLYVEEWVEKNHKYEAAIRSGIIPKSVVEKRIDFEYQVYMIQPTDDKTASASLNRKVESLGGDLLDEVVNEATRFFAKNLSGKDSCGASTAATLRKIRDKVDGLSFLNSSFIPLVNLLDETLKGYAVHKEGRVIRAPFFYQIMAAVLIMSDRKRIEEYAEGAVTISAMTQQVSLKAPATVAFSGSSGSGYEPLSAEDFFELLGSDQGGTNASDPVIDAEDEVESLYAELAAEPGMNEDKDAETEESTDATADVLLDIDADLDDFFSSLSDKGGQAGSVPESPEVKNHSAVQTAITEVAEVIINPEPEQQTFMVDVTETGDEIPGFENMTQLDSYEMDKPTSTEVDCLIQSEQLVSNIDDADDFGASFSW